MFDVVAIIVEVDRLLGDEAVVRYLESMELALIGLLYSTFRVKIIKQICWDVVDLLGCCRSAQGTALGCEVRPCLDMC